MIYKINYKIKMLSFNLKNNFRRIVKTKVNSLAYGAIENQIPKVFMSRFSTLRELEVLQTKVDKQSQEFQVSNFDSISIYKNILN